MEGQNLVQLAGHFIRVYDRGRFGGASLRPLEKQPEQQAQRTDKKGDLPDAAVYGAAAGVEGVG